MTDNWVIIMMMGWDGMGWDGMGLDWIGLDWIGLDWIGSDWIRLDGIGLFVVMLSADKLWLRGGDGRSSGTEQEAQADQIASDQLLSLLFSQSPKNSAVY
ncbi:hypothetical protein niasHT_003092 [Heterodera trifolii]|uniref:Uncharacterized protein n=1 Tax=Heterodera trifolii TaxID=157864 RepID=A0ABD2M535_9BILA